MNDVRVSKRTLLLGVTVLIAVVLCLLRACSANLFQGTGIYLGPLGAYPLDSGWAPPIVAVLIVVVPQLAFSILEWLASKKTLSVKEMLTQALAVLERLEGKAATEAEQIVEHVEAPAAAVPHQAGTAAK